MLSSDLGVESLEPTDEEFNKLMGIVEVDETFVGGLAKNRHKDKRGDGSGGTGGSGYNSGAGGAGGAVSATVTEKNAMGGASATVHAQGGTSNNVGG